MVKKITLDLKNQTIEDFHKEIKQKLGFPDFYGANVNALIDCMSSMRFPEERMSNITLDKDEILIIECKGLSQSNIVVLNNFLISIEHVNQRELKRGNSPSIYLCIV
ncbi:barstar family protein [Bacteroides fragilis]|uniref:barstar family protein n=1 Tax=Bacteroides fragilis TaxID=817 RepID=UPI00202ED97C|nr:barstar family protein [Bacteroides fragilis]MCM0340387.1 barstar family protein [Bacteroides fragilis]